MKTQLQTLGSNTTIDFVGYAMGVPAKVDTGADSSSVWASDISVDKDGYLHFKLFGPASDSYSGEEVVRKNFTVARVRSSNGHSEPRYRTHFSIRIGSKRIRALFNLSNRSQNQFPVLIGRRTLSGKFIVDVSQKEHLIKKPLTSRELREELARDPYEFHQKHRESKVE